jgi:UDP-N-acetylmuramate: L-alanyl-gamma-D-glutamyl-meso-diaminopimelate ligase
MRIHILGIGGTFMAGMARLAVALGHQVSGSDAALYPPMSTQLDELGVAIFEGYDDLTPLANADLIVIGNALSRGAPVVEYVLNHDLRYMSGPEWLERFVLPGRHVIAVAGTHGKTTVSSLVTWMLEYAGLEPGFLVGGVLENFSISARLGAGRYFVIEADEYDTAFFDKRSKFVHYHPRTLIINNLEYDHADIFPDLGAIQRQFHHLIRTVPGEAQILVAAEQPAIDDTLQLGCWSEVTRFGRDAGCDWQFQWQDGEQRHIALISPDGTHASGPTPLMGLHNAWNVCAAAAAAAHVGVTPKDALDALTGFTSVRRRLELRGQRNGVSVYDDFAHHPTAIAATIAALRGGMSSGRIITLLELRSNTMAMGIHKSTLGAALAGADSVAILTRPDLSWTPSEELATERGINYYADPDIMARDIAAQALPGDHILVMSNGAFANIHDKLLEHL